MKQLFFLLCSLPVTVFAQDTIRYKLDLSLPVIDIPQNKDIPHRYPSMQQATALSSDLYDLGYLGINKLGNALFRPQNKSVPVRRALNGLFKWGASLAFVKWGSELPVPLGVWSHEEYHRAVLGANGIAARNGNWIFGRWDGSVYGVRDEQLAGLKQQNLLGLLYAYVAGVQSENYQTQTNLLQDFYHQRTTYKNALYLYNAWYVWDYLRFSTSPLTDSVKKGAVPYESKDPAGRDFAGADFTAWAYDMFQPSKPYNSRDPFPGGQGVNRRIGFGELPAEAQQYLNKQKKLSLFNFVNPAIFFINRINVSGTASFNFFLQYTPTPFGNNIAVWIPVQVRTNNYLFAVHRYSNYRQSFAGVEAGFIDHPVGKKIEAGGKVGLWTQPVSQGFYDEKGKAGGFISLDVKYKAGKNFSAGIALGAKTRGWQMGNPYLESNTNFRAGIYYRLPDR